MNDLLKPDTPPPFELSTCAHENITKASDSFFCTKCGSLQPEDGSSVMKSRMSYFPGKVDGISNLKAQWKRHFLKPDLPNDYMKQRQIVIDNMSDWAERLKLSQNSLFLAISFLDFYISRKPKVDATQYRVLGATALMLGAKSIELDERIPFISKLRRHTHLPYATSDFRKCECQLLNELNFTLQYTTLIDWVESSLSIGAIFDNDELQSDNILREKSNNNPLLTKYNEISTNKLATPIINLSENQEFVAATDRKKLVRDLPTYKISDLVEKFENTVKKLAYMILKDGSFLYEDPRRLTLSVLSYARRIVGLKKEIPLIWESLYQFDSNLIDSLAEKFPILSFIPKTNVSNLTTFVKQPQVTYYPIQLQRSYTLDQEFNSLSYMNQMKHVNQIYKNQYLTTATATYVSQH